MPVRRPRPTSPPRTRPSRTNPRASTVALVLALLATVVAYLPALRGPFELDDADSIVANQSITRFVPLSVPLSPPRATPVAGRPVVNLSFALNYALNDALGVVQTPTLASAAAMSYRVVNLALHLCCALIIFALLRETLGVVRLFESSHDAGDWITVLVTALWLLHPLQTEAIDYVTQRTEILVSLFYMGTLYAAARAWSARGDVRSHWWSAVAIATCFLGMESKEVMITAPVAVLLYDLAFHGDALRADSAARRRRVVLYGALIVTSIPMLVTVARGARADSVGFGLGISWIEYAYSQAWAVAHYLQLVLWPAPLTFDYGQQPVHGAAGIPGLFLLAAIALFIVHSWPRRRWAAFLALWFLLLLAPSSSVIPIRTEIAAERRMYLALLPVLLLLFAGAEWLWRYTRRIDGDRHRLVLSAVAVAAALVYFFASRWTASRLSLDHAHVIQLGFAVAGVALLWLLVVWAQRRLAVGALLAGLALLTARRSLAYADAETLWHDTVVKAPHNARAYDNLAAVIYQKDPSRVEEVRQYFGAAILADSTYPYAWTNLADVELRVGRPAAARALLEHVLRIIPNYVDATDRLGGVYLQLGDPAQAIPHLERVAGFRPTVETLGALATAYAQVQRMADARRTIERAIALDPRRTDAWSFLTMVLLEQGHADSAAMRLHQVLRTDSSATLLALTAVVESELRNPGGAAAAASAAAARPDANAATFAQLGRAMITVRDLESADRYLTRAVTLAPSEPDAAIQLGAVKATVGDTAAARTIFERVLSDHPDYEPARQGLAKLRALTPR